MENLDERYKVFSEELLHDYRYILSEASQSFLRDILAIANKHFYTEIDEGMILYRARINDEKKNGKAVSPSLDARPFAEMKPIPNVVSGGRVNAQNICVLYTADRIGTALAEVRASANQPVTVATFETNKPLKLVKLSQRMDWYKYFLSEPIAKDFWFNLSYEFSIPTTPGLEYRNYVRTQVIAEYFKSNGYDGIIYRSQFHAHEDKLQAEYSDGYNYALFDIASAD